MSPRPVEEFDVTDTLEADTLEGKKNNDTTIDDNTNNEGERPLKDTISRIMDAPNFVANQDSLIFQLSFYYENNSELFLVVNSDIPQKEEKFQILSDDQKTFDLLAEKITNSVEKLYNVFPKKADYKKQKKAIEANKNK